MRTGESRREPGGVRGAHRRVGGAVEAGGGAARVRARRPHALLPAGRSLKTVGHLVGWPSGARPDGLHSGWAVGGSSPFLFLFLFCFLFILICFELVKILTHFVKS